MRLMGPASMKRQEDVSLNVTVECAAVVRATCRQPSRPATGNPQLTTMRFCLVESSNDTQPAWACWLTAIGGGRPASIRTTVPALSRRRSPELEAFVGGAPRASSHALTL